MPKFVQSVANQQTPPPYHFPNVRAHGFLIDIPMDAVQTYCDTYFNLGDAKERGFVYRPVAMWPYALLMVIEYPMMINSNRGQLGYAEIPFADRGYASQNEVFLAVPVLRHGAGVANFLLDAAVEWALPFIVVDNTTSAFSGREILGLEKLWGEIDLGAGSYPRGFSVRVSIPGWTSLNSQVMQQMLPIIAVTTGTPLPSVGRASDVTSPWTTLQSPFALKAFEFVAGAFDGLCTLSSGLIPSPMNLVALKQFRDARDPHRAIYQALVGARSRYYDVSDLQLYNEQDVSITLNPSGSFAEIARIFAPAPPDPRAAGAETDPVAPLGLTARGAFSFRANLDFDEMRTVHTFPVDGDDCADEAPNIAGDLLSPWLTPLWGFFKPTAPTGSAT
jgi:hypothetical protein